MSGGYSVADYDFTGATINGKIGTVGFGTKASLGMVDVAWSRQIAKDFDMGVGAAFKISSRNDDVQLLKISRQSSYDVFVSKNLSADTKASLTLGMETSRVEFSGNLGTVKKPIYGIKLAHKLTDNVSLTMRSTLSTHRFKINAQTFNPTELTTFMGAECSF